MNNNTSPFEKNNGVDINSTIPATPNTGFDINSTMPANQNTGFDPNFSGNFDRPAAFYPTQPTVQTPAFVQAPVVKQDNSLMEWLKPLIVCGAGISGIALGIASLAAAGNIYGTIGTAEKTIPSSTNITAGPSPVISLIMAILALILGAAAVVLGILFGNQAASQGKPRGTGLTIGTACGIAAVVVCLFALFFTGCATCSYCSIKDYVDDQFENALSTASRYYG